jgi:hypothetical protein
LVRLVYLFQIVPTIPRKTINFEAEPNRNCFTRWWYDLLPISISGIMLYVVGIPSLVFFLFFERQKILKKDFTTRNQFQTFILKLSYCKVSEFKENVGK